MKRPEPGTFWDEVIETIKWFPVLIAFCVVLTIVLMFLVKVAIWVIQWSP